VNFGSLLAPLELFQPLDLVLHPVFIGRYEHLFTNLNEARNIIEEWRIDYNTNRPHSSLNGLTPTEFAARPDQGHNRNRLSL
jgi:transposase InsO family protein